MSEVLCECCNSEGDHPSRIICDACFLAATGKATCCILTQAENEKLKQENERLKKAYQKTIDELFNRSCACSKTMERNFEQILKGK